MSRTQTTALKLSPMRRLLAIMAALSLVLTGLTMTAQQASAAPNFKAPWVCGVGWHASTYATHGAAVDFNNLADGSDAGKPVLASASGTATVVANHGTLGNYVDIDHGGGWLTRYAHLVAAPSIVDRNGSQSGIQVNQGDHIGNVGSTGKSDAPHLHFEQRLNGVGQAVAFDGVTIPVGTSYTTADPVHTSTNCSSGGSSPTEPRIGVLNDEGELSVKAGPLNAMWFHVSSATFFKMSPNRIAVLGNSGTLVVKEGPLNATWTTVSTGVSSFDVTNSRIVIRDSSGVVSVKEGPLNAVWSQISSGASAVELN